MGKKLKMASQRPARLTNMSRFLLSSHYCPVVYFQFLVETFFLENTMILGRKWGNLRLIPSEDFFF